MFDELFEKCLSVVLNEAVVQGFSESSEELERQIFKILQKVIKDHIATGDTKLGDVVIKSVKIMGSRLKGTAKPDSDLDVLVEYEGFDDEDLAFWTLRSPDLEVNDEINGIIIDVTPKKVG